MSDRCDICGNRTVLAETVSTIPWWDCGGHCTLCMAWAGDLDSIRAIERWLSLAKNVVNS